MASIQQTIGQQIRDVRITKGLTQQQLGNRIGVTRSIITNYEAGRQNFTVSTLQKVATALGLDLNVIIK